MRSLNDIDAMSELIMKLDELLTSAEVYSTLADKEYILNCTFTKP